MVRSRLAIGRFILWVNVVSAMTGGVSAQETNDTSASCGMTVYTLPEAPLLGSFPSAFRSSFKTALQKDVVAYAKWVFPDPDWNNTVPLDQALHIFRIPTPTSDKQLYIAWWYEQAICGAHGNCAMWLVEIDKGQARNLIAADDPQNPGRTLGTGSGIGTKKDSQQPYLELMTTAHGYKPPPAVGPETEVACYRHAGHSYVKSDCPVGCFPSLNNSQ